nr:LacI family DNA-binding transcriptional regulator [uncultured Ralstonia sp.]
MLKQVTAQEVADAAGVSRSAVSRTLSNSGYVSEETRTKVLKAADALGYRVNHLARGLNKQRSDLVGLVVADLDTPFRSQQLKDLSEALLESQFRPLLIPTTEGRDSSQVIDMLMRYSVSGVIITSDTPPAEIYQNCIRHELPVVLINKADRPPKVDRVLCDNEKGIALLTDFFLQAQCQQVAVVAIEKERGSYSIRSRERLFVSYARGMGIQTSVIRAPKHDYQGGIMAARELLSMSSLPDGVFCTSDYMAMGLIDQLKQKLSASQFKKMRIAGFDDIPQASWLNYQLTTIRQSTRDLANAAVGLLKRRIDHPEHDAQTEVIDVQLIIR